MTRKLSFNEITHPNKSNYSFLNDEAFMIKIFTAMATNTNVQHTLVKDHNRYWWWISAIYPATPIISIICFLILDNEWLLALPLFALGFAVPVMDFIVGTNQDNPSDLLSKKMNKDSYYNNILCAAIPIHFLAVIAPAWLIATHDLSNATYIALSIAVGLYSGLSINTAHELGHKTNKFERLLSRITLSVTGYGHFCIDHNSGHHQHVATPDDPTSARMGESLYRFALREIPGVFMRGWRLEKNRLTKRKLPIWHYHNLILQSYAMTLVWQGLVVYTLGFEMLPFLLIQNSIAWLQLTTTNSIEHYGLLRKKLINGRYERCAPHHSWNSNHLVSNFLLFHLQRHSDHHTNPSRPYQTLRSYKSLPEMPSGYLGMYLLAYVPPLWFLIMDKRLLEIEHIQGDLTKVNIDPKNVEKYYRNIDS